MPWAHCGETILDDQECPICGQSKGNWTITIEHTRVLRVGTASLDLRLREEGGDPVVGARYSVRSSDGKLFEGLLGDDGAARLANLKPGPCQVSFDDLAAEDLVEQGGLESFPIKPGPNTRTLTLRWSFDAEADGEEWDIDHEGVAGVPPADDTPDDGQWELETLDGEGDDVDEKDGWGIESLERADDVEAADGQVEDDPFAAPPPADDPFAT